MSDTGSGAVINPKATISLKAASEVEATEGRRDLVVGQLGVDATATSEALVENVQELGTDDIIDQFGEGEMARRIIELIKGNGGYSQVDAVGISPESSGVAATATVAFSGTSTKSGTITIVICDSKLFSFDLDVVSGETATELGDALVDAIDDSESYPPFTASNSSGTVTITAKDVGTVGNYFVISYDGSVAGVTTTLTGWSGGTTDPTVTGILDAIDNIRYTGINWPEYWQDDADVVTDLLDNRFNVDNNIMDGVAFMGLSDTYANISSYLDDYNTQSLCPMGNKTASEDYIIGPCTNSFPSWDSAYFEGVRSRRLTEDTSLSDYIEATGSKDATGGDHTASLPYFNTEMAQMDTYGLSLSFNNTEQEDLADLGYTIIGSNRKQTAMIMGEVVTTYTTDSSGNSNTSFHYLNFVDTASICRETFFNYFESVFSQSRLTEGDCVNGYTMNNEQSIAAECLAIYKILAAEALTQSGDTATSYFSDNLSVSISLAKRKATITSFLPIVTQLGKIIYTMTLSFSTKTTGTTNV